MCRLISRILVTAVTLLLGMAGVAHGQAGTLGVYYGTRATPGPGLFEHHRFGVQFVIPATATIDLYPNLDVKHDDQGDWQLVAAARYGPRAADGERGPVYVGAGAVIKYAQLNFLGLIGGEVKLGGLPIFTELRLVGGIDPFQLDIAAGVRLQLY